MRKIYHLIFLLISTGAIAQQQWPEIGVKFGGGSSYLINMNVFNDESVKSPYSFGSYAGIKYGFNFSTSNGITVDLLYSGFNQTYKSDNDSMSWDKKIHLSHIDLPILYRTFSELSYFEVGPQISYLTGAKETFTSYLPGAEKFNYTTSDLTNFNAYNVAALIGFGTALYGRDNFFVMLEFRGIYGLLDIYSHTGPYGDNYPYDTFPAYQSGETPKPYKASTMLSGQLGVEINYNFRSFH